MIVPSAEEVEVELPTSTTSDPNRMDHVIVRRSGQYVGIHPVIPNVIETFYTAEHVCEPRTGRVVVEPFPLVWEQPLRPMKTMVLQSFAGMEPLLIAWLIREGYTHELRGRRPGDLGEHDAEQVGSEITEPDPAVMEFVRYEERGLLRFDPQKVSPTSLIAQIALGWPKKRILVVVTRREDAVRLRNELEEFLPRVSLFAGRTPRRAARVVVATPRFVKSGAIAVEKRSVYISLNPDELFPTGVQTPLDDIKRAGRARMYGLLPIGAEVPPYTRSLITALFGFKEVVVPRHGHALRKVDVAFMTVHGGPDIAELPDELAIRRNGIWKHPVRNRRIAKLASLLATKKYGTAHQQFPNLGSLQLRRGGNRVMVLVENLEHALAMAKYLPEAPIVFGPDHWTGDLSTAQKDRLKLRRPRKPHVTIATLTGLPDVDRMDVLLRADAGRGLPPLSEEQRVVPHVTADHLLVIDCLDRHHGLLLAMSRKRRKAYLAADWRIDGEPSQTPLDRFLAARPKVRT
jgi:hypothetical protein